MGTTSTDDGSAILAALGSAIREHRTAAGLTQGQLAERAGAGRPHLNHIEGGRKSRLWSCWSIWPAASASILQFCCRLRRSVRRHTETARGLNALDQRGGLFMIRLTGFIGARLNERDQIATGTQLIARQLAETHRSARLCIASSAPPGRLSPRARDPGSVNDCLDAANGCRCRDQGTVAAPPSVGSWDLIVSRRRKSRSLPSTVVDKQTRLGRL